MPQNDKKFLCAPQLYSFCKYLKNFIYLFIYLFVYLFIYLFVYLFIYLFLTEKCTKSTENMFAKF